MTTETVTVPVSWLDRLLGRVTEAQPEPEPKGEPPTVLTATVDVDKFAAVQAERDDLAAKIEQMESARTLAARVEKFEGELAGTSLAGDEGLPALLAGLTDEVATEVLRRFKALAAQETVAALTADVGHAGNPATGDPVGDLDKVVRSVMTKDNLDYNRALGKLAAEQPELLKAAYGR